jgi:branched-chain amino acid transport system permease protein
VISDATAQPLAPQPAVHPVLAAVLRNAWIPLALAGLYLVAAGYEFADPPTWWPVMLRPKRFPDWWPYVVHVGMLAGISITLAVSLQLINGIAGQFSLGHAGFKAVGAYLGGYAITACGTLSTDSGDQTFVNAAGVAGYFVLLLALLALVGLGLGGVVALLRLSRRVHARIPMVLLVACVCWWIATDVLGLGRVTVGGLTITPFQLIGRLWSLVAGVFGGCVESMAGWAAPLSLALPEAARRPATFLVMLAGGGVLAAVAGLLVGLPTLRLRGDYLAIATLGFAEIIRVAIVNSPALGGATGMSVADVYWRMPDPDGLLSTHHMLPWVYGVALLTTLTVWRIKHSPKGRSLAAVREDEVAAAAVGVDPTRHKVIAFTIGAGFAGVAGALYASLDGYLNANSFSFMYSVELVVMVTLGGLGSIAGAIIAAVVLTALPEVLRNAAGFTDLIPRNIDEYRMIIYSLLLIALMLLRAAPWRQQLVGWWRRRGSAPVGPAGAPS